MLNCVDLSNYSGPLSPVQAQGLKDAGIQLVIVQAVDPPPGFPPCVDQQQAQAVIDGGLKLGVYVYEWTATHVARSNASRFAAYGFPVERWWGDFEDTSPADPVARELGASALLDYLDTLGGKRPAGAYSGQWWTDGYLPAESQVFAGRAIWVSAYNGIDTLDAPALCGGTVMIHQYAGTSTLAGVGNVDLNAANPSEFTENGGTPPVTDEERTQMQGRIDSLTNTIGYVLGDAMSPLTRKTAAKYVQTFVAIARAEADKQGINHS